MRVLNSIQVFIDSKIDTNRFSYVPCDDDARPRKRSSQYRNTRIYGEFLIFCHGISQYYHINKIHITQSNQTRSPLIVIFLYFRYLVPLSGRDEFGRCVMFSCVGRFDPYKYTSADMARVHTLISESLMDDPENQINGLCRTETEFTNIITVKFSRLHRIQLRQRRVRFADGTHDAVVVFRHKTHHTVFAGAYPQGICFGRNGHVY